MDCFSPGKRGSLHGASLRICLPHRPLHPAPELPLLSGTLLQHLSWGFARCRVSPPGIRDSLFPSTVKMQSSSPCRIQPRSGKRNSPPPPSILGAPSSAVYFPERPMITRYSWAQIAAVGEKRCPSDCPLRGPRRAAWPGGEVQLATVLPWLC